MFKGIKLRLARQQFRREQEQYQAGYSYAARDRFEAAIKESQR